MMNMDVVLREIDKNGLTPDPYELAARLGLGCSCMGDKVEDLLAEVIYASRPKYSVRRLRAEYPECGVSVLGGHRIESEGLFRCLCGSPWVLLLAVTLGGEVDRYLYRLGMLSGADRFVADGVASALAEAACEQANRELAVGASLTKRFSPGYGDLSLSHQEWLLSETCAGELLGVGLTESGMMVPMKTITAIIGIKNDE